MMGVFGRERVRCPHINNGITFGPEFPLQELSNSTLGERHCWPTRRGRCPFRLKKYLPVRLNQITKPHLIRFRDGARHRKSSSSVLFAITFFRSSTEVLMDGLFRCNRPQIAARAILGQAVGEVNIAYWGTYNFCMSNISVTANRPAETDPLLVKFEIDNIPDDYREYYGAKRSNFFASIQNFGEMWDLYLRLDAVWLRGVADLKIVGDPRGMFPLMLYINAHAKIRASMELAFAGCMSEARSILRDAVEFIAHGHSMVNDPDLQKTWLSKNDGSAALESFKDAFERHKRKGVFNGLDELHKAWGDLSETGSHANINAVVDRFVQITDGKHVTFKLNYTGVESERVWRTSIFSMLLTSSTMLATFLSDYDGRLNLDDTLMRMRCECDQVKEQIREMLKVRYKIEPPRGIHAPPKPTIFRP
jgi:hypothetical protein